MDVSGVVVIEPEHPATDGATVTVRLLDVSRLDAASVTLAEAVVTRIVHRVGERTEVPFSLAVPGAIAANTELSVEAHVNMEPARPAAMSGVGPSDLVTASSNPVPVTGAAGIELRLRQARPTT